MNAFLRWLVFASFLPFSFYFHVLALFVSSFCSSWGSLPLFGVWCLLTGHVKAATYPGVGGQGSARQRVAIQAYFSG